MAHFATLLRRALPALPALVLVVALTTPARAATPWSTSPLPPGSEWAYGEVLFTAAGNGVGLFGQSLLRPASVLMGFGATGSGTEPAQDGRFDGAWDLSTFGDDGLLAIGGPTNVPIVRIGTPSQGLKTASPPDAPDLRRGWAGVAANRSGDIAVLGRGRAGGYELWLRRRGRASFVMARRFTVPAGAPVLDYSFNMNPSGDMLLTYSRYTHRRSLYARRIDRIGRVGPELLIGVARGARGGFSVAALESDGRAVVAWQEFARVRLATAPPGRGFGTPQTVRDDGAARAAEGFDEGGSGFRLVPTGSGGELLAWTAIRGRSQVVRAANVVAGRLGAAQQLTPAGWFTIADVSATPDKAAVVLWSRASAATDQTLYASVRVNGRSPFGAPEPIDTAAVYGFTSAALDPVTGRVLVSYVNGVPALARVARRSTVAD